MFWVFSKGSKCRRVTKRSLSTSESGLRLVNACTGRVLADSVEIARGLVRRFVGAIGRHALDGALGLSSCDWVHTFLVRFPLDIVYCDRDGSALRVLAGIAPNRLAPRVPGAYWAWEMRAGHLAPYVTPGDRLIITTPASEA